MVTYLATLVKYRQLLYMITWRDIIIKYKQSVMGFLWAIFMPMIIISAGILVKYAFSYLSKVPLQLSDIVTVSVKAVPWAFFVTSVRFSANSLLSNASLVTKIYFPRALFPIASVVSSLFDFLLSSAVLVIFLCIARIGISIHLIWVPILLSLLTVLSMGLGLYLSAANLFFRDVKYLVEVILTFAIFFTPVFYEVSMFQNWAKILLLNPVAPILEGLNSCVVLHQMPDISWTLYTAVVSITGLVTGVLFFKELEPAFAESI